MANVNPPKKNQAWGCDVELEDWLNPGQSKVNPTLAAGDVKISTDNGAETNINTLPTVSPASSAGVSVVTNSSEMNGDKVRIRFHDQTVPPEWADKTITINTTP